MQVMSMVSGVVMWAAMMAAPAMAAPAVAAELEPMSPARAAALVTSPYSLELELSDAADEDGTAAEEDDDLLGGGSGEESVKEEQDAVRRGETAEEDEAGDDRRSVIMTIQQKNFMKVGRFEAGPTLGSVVNDPFLKRFIIGAVLDYHFTEVFGVEWQLAYAPIFGTGGENDPDWKELSKQLREMNSVAPDISKLTLNTSFSFLFSPIYGKAAIFRTILIFDIFGNFGAGIVQTSDDLVALGADENDEEAIATQNQWHPTTIIGGGIRVAFNRTVTMRLEGKSMTYIEVINSSTLEMKNNFVLQGGATFFFPQM